MNIVVNTEKFAKKREELNAAQNVILSLNTIEDESLLPGINDSMKKFDSKLKDLTDKGKDMLDLLNVDSKKLKSVIAGEYNKKKRNKDDIEDPNGIEKGEAPNFENFYAPLIAQSISAHTTWILKRKSGFLETREFHSKALSTEAQGIVAAALNTILSINVSGVAEVDTGWMELYRVTDQLQGTSSARIMSIANAIQARRVRERQKAEPVQPLTMQDMEETKYEKYSIALLYANFEKELTSYFNTIGGVNGIFTQFRIAMAEAKTKVAYQTIHLKPEHKDASKFIWISKELRDKPDPTNSLYNERVEYKLKRFAANIDAAYSELLEEARKHGLINRSATSPMVHAVYNPLGPGAFMVRSLMLRMANTQLPPLDFSANIVFHPSSLAPKSGAWEAIKGENDVFIEDELGFIKVKEADTAFGIMLVIPMVHVHGVNSPLYNISVDYPENDTTAYLANERFTFHTVSYGRMWIRNLVPVSDSIMTPLED